MSDCQSHSLIQLIHTANPCWRRRCARTAKGPWLANYPMGWILYANSPPQSVVFLHSVLLDRILDFIVIRNVPHPLTDGELSETRLTKLYLIQPITHSIMTTTTISMITTSKMRKSIPSTNCRSRYWRALPHSRSKWKTNETLDNQTALDNTSKLNKSLKIVDCCSHHIYIMDVFLSWFFYPTNGGDGIHLTVYC